VLWCDHLLSFCFMWCVYVCMYIKRYLMCVSFTDGLGTSICHLIRSPQFSLATASLCSPARAWCDAPSSAPLVTRGFMVFTRNRNSARAAVYVMRATRRSDQQRWPSRTQYFHTHMGLPRRSLGRRRGMVGRHPFHQHILSLPIFTEAQYRLAHNTSPLSRRGGTFF